MPTSIAVLDVKEQQQVVLESLVQSGFLAKQKDQDQDWSTHFLKCQKTRPGLEKTKTAVFFSLGLVLVQTGYNQFKTGFSTTYAINFAIGVGKFIATLLSF